MIDVLEVSLGSRPSSLEQFYEPTDRVEGTWLTLGKLEWLHANPGKWLRWSKNNYPTSARAIRNPMYEKWRGGASSPSERGLWVKLCL